MSINVFTSWQNVLLLFGLRAVELLCLCYFLSQVRVRKAGWWITALQVMGFAGLQVAANWSAYQFDWESEFIYIGYAYYPLIFAFIMCRHDISIREGVYHLLLFFLCIHALRPLLMRFSVILYGVNFMIDSSRPQLSLMFVAALAAVLLLIFTLLKKLIFYYPRHRLSWAQLALIFITTIPVVYIMNLFLVLNTEMAYLPVSTMIIGVVCSICGIIVVIGYNNILALEKNKQEMASLEALLATQQKQYQLKKETTELINTRYHDLKKHINYLSTIDSPEEREEYLSTFKLQISLYDAFHDTGNDTLDIVLSDKDMECRKHNIALLLFLDGRQLGFLKQLDIVTIFSNAIDNGIEAVKNLPAEERAITIRMREYDTWLAVSFENSFTGALKWKGQRLVSTKNGSGDHGYGLLSIENTVERYGGNVTVDAQDRRFVLTLLFPKAAGGF